MTATVIISFHTLFLTKVDRAYRINCFYMEASKTVTQQLDVSMLTTQDLNNNVPMPVCRYDILQGDAQVSLVQHNPSLLFREHQYVSRVSVTQYTTNGRVNHKYRINSACEYIRALLMMDRVVLILMCWIRMGNHTVIEIFDELHRY